MCDYRLSVLTRRTYTHWDFWKDMAARAAAQHHPHPINFIDYINWCHDLGKLPITLPRGGVNPFVPPRVVALMLLREVLSDDDGWPQWRGNRGDDGDGDGGCEGSEGYDDDGADGLDDDGWGRWGWGCRNDDDSRDRGWGSSRRRSDDRRRREDQWWGTISLVAARLSECPECARRTIEECVKSNLKKESDPFITGGWVNGG